MQINVYQRGAEGMEGKSDSSQGKDMIIQIPVEKLIEDKHNRKVGGVDVIQSVGTLGVLQPILVFPQGESYKIVAGARRVASAKHFGLPVVPAIVLEEEDARIQAAENFDRKDLNPIDESDMINALLKKGMTREAIASWMNISVQQVARREKLGQLSTKMKNLVKSGQVSAAVASEFVVLPKEKQDEFLESYEGKNIASLSQSGARDKLRWKVGRRLDTCVPDLLMMVDMRGESCKSCIKCEGSDDMTLFEESEDKTCFDSECFKRRLCEYVKRYKVPFLSRNPKMNEISETTLDDSYHEVYYSNGDSIEGIDDYGKPTHYAKSVIKTEKTAEEDPTKNSRKAFNSHVDEMNALLESIEKITGEALEAAYLPSREIDTLSREVMLREQYTGNYEYDRVKIQDLVSPEEQRKSKIFAKAMLIAEVGDPIRWKKTGTRCWPLPPHRDNPLIKLAAHYVKHWTTNEVRLQYAKLWDLYLLEQWREGNEGVEPLLIAAGNLNKETWK
ncbi:MAG: ParB/RepB/Spo0J family partition protein [Spirochaetia bacterium]|nr:ParB/RepB/Spo0J family partition protein [Spirochaetia bacterium]